MDEKTKRSLIDLLHPGLNYQVGMVGHIDGKLVRGANHGGIDIVLHDMNDGRVTQRHLLSERELEDDSFKRHFSPRVHEQIEAFRSKK